jgi:hypothetical protein
MYRWKTRSGYKSWPLQHGEVDEARLINKRFADTLVGGLREKPNPGNTG